MTEEDMVQLTVLRPFDFNNSVLLRGYRITVDRARAQVLLREGVVKLTTPSDAWNATTANV